MNRSLGLAVFALGCHSNAPAPDPSVGSAPVVSTRDPVAECGTILDHAVAKLGDALKTIGIKETPAHARTRNAVGIAACAKLADVQRTCLLDGTCKTPSPSPFVLFDGTAAREALLGAKVAPADSAPRIAKLAGIWHHAAEGLDDTIDWKLAADGALTVKHTPKHGKPTTEPAHQLVFVRDRQLAEKTGTSMQFVPAFVDGDTLYLSWTSGALAVPVSGDTYALPDGGDRWVVHHGTTCELVDPSAGATPLPCSDDAARLGYSIDGHVRNWLHRGDALVDSTMELYTRAK